MNRFAALGTGLLFVAAVAGMALAQTDHGAMGHGQPAGAMSPASKAYMEAMTAMDAGMKAMAMTGKPGADFALMMIPHHQGAIDMAKAYLASGEADPELTTLSEEIIAAQEREIAFLRAWLAKQPE